jgi:hypothetical protein
MKKILTFTLAIVMLISLFVFAGCDTPAPPEVIPAVDYSLTNNYDYEVVESDDFVTYVPDANATHGFLFYLGTSVAPKYYQYLASALAKQGYLVVISTNGFPYMFYDKDEPTFEEYPNIKFFVGGHSQGGAAAVKRTNEHRDEVVGVVLLAPLAYPHDSIADTDIPVLLLEATNDGVLSADMKADAKRSIPYNSEQHLIEGCHMSFSTMDSDETLSLFHDGPATPEQKEAQRASTLSFVLAFMNRIASAN